MSNIMFELCYLLSYLYLSRCANYVILKKNYTEGTNMRVFSQKHTAPIILPQQTHKAIVLAAQDLQRDLRRLSGRRDGFDLTRTGTEGILIRTVPGAQVEAYTVCVESNCVCITGTDVLGTVYGIYAFSRQCLGVVPMHAFMDIFPPVQQALTLSAQQFSSTPRAVRFRGWFLNDEDLLSQWKPGGQRNIDYPFYQTVMHTDVLSLVLEAALRLEINLVIPGSFVDILNPDEEKLVQTVCDRGLYISQHHVEPVGVSYFAAENYLKARGICEAISFCSNRERMVEIWRCYIEKWAQYGPQVVWQLGLRGKGDQAVWRADPTAPQDLQACGQIITDAIATQHSLISQALGREDFFSTATLWNEGSQMYSAGALQLPPNTIAVFSDFGISQMFGQDFYSTPRLPGHKYGVYYHVAFWNLGPHLTEGCDPRKMEYCYNHARQLDSLEYSILNVSNVRPLHVSVTLNAQLLADPAGFQADRALQEFHKGVFGPLGQQVYSLHRQYYDAFADFGKEPLQRAATDWHFYYFDHKDLPFPENAVTDGQLAWIGKNLVRGIVTAGAHAPDQQALQALRTSAEKFGKLEQDLQQLEQQLQPAQKGYLQRFLGYQTKHMHRMTQWAICCILMGMDSTPAQQLPQLYKQACDQIHQLLQARLVLEEGPWENWHAGDQKINLPAMLTFAEGIYQTACSTRK